MNALTVQQAQYARLATDAAGASLRAAVAGVIPALDLDKPLPGDLFLAFRARPVGGQSHDMRPVVSEWWVYDVRSQGTARIDSTIALIQAAYPRTALAYAETVITQIGQPAIDAALNRLTRFVQLTSYTRG